MAAKQLLFVMIKPDGVKRKLVGEIISRFERKGFDLLLIEVRNPVREMIEEHYKEHRHKGFFEKLVNFTLSGPVIMMVWNGDVQVARNIVGATVPWEAEKGTIRGDLACSMDENLIHCSDSIESSKREIGLWFPDL